MRRVSVHAAFAIVALACAAFAGYAAVRLANARRVHDEVAALSAPLVVPAVEAVLTHSSAPTVSAVPAVAPKPLPATADPSGERAPDDDAPRPVQLAHAIALSAAGRYAAAGRRFEALIESGPLDEIGRAALYDLANLYLREGAGETASAVHSLPMIEQAKARYRALLRVAPDDWDARYNLERALRLAPETQGMEASDATTKHGVKLRGAQSEDLP